MAFLRCEWRATERCTGARKNTWRALDQRRMWSLTARLSKGQCAYLLSMLLTLQLRQWLVSTQIGMLDSGVVILFSQCDRIPLLWQTVLSLLVKLFIYNETISHDDRTNKQLCNIFPLFDRVLSGQQCHHHPWLNSWHSLGLRCQLMAWAQWSQGLFPTLTFGHFSHWPRSFSASPDQVFWARPGEGEVAKVKFPYVFQKLPRACAYKKTAMSRKNLCEHHVHPPGNM